MIAEEEEAAALAWNHAAEALSLRWPQAMNLGALSIGVV